MAHGGVVLLLSGLIVGLGAEFDIGLPAGSPLPRESQVDASGAVLHVNALCGGRPSVVGAQNRRNGTVMANGKGENNVMGRCGRRSMELEIISKSDMVFAALTVEI